MACRWVPWPGQRTQPGLHCRCEPCRGRDHASSRPAPDGPLRRCTAASRAYTDPGATQSGLKHNKETIVDLYLSQPGDAPALVTVLRGLRVPFTTHIVEGNVEALETLLDLTDSVELPTLVFAD